LLVIPPELCNIQLVKIGEIGEITSREGDPTANGMITLKWIL
jgi:hypothetical protein